MPRDDRRHSRLQRWCSAYRALGSCKTDPKVDCNHCSPVICLDGLPDLADGVCRHEEIGAVMSERKLVFREPQVESPCCGKL